MDRRKFSKSALLITTGIGISPMLLRSKTRPYSVEDAFWLAVLARFAVRVGYDIIVDLAASYIKDYLTEEYDYRFKNDINSLNNNLIEQGYRNPGNSPIYSKYPNLKNDIPRYVEDARDDVIIYQAQDRNTNTRVFPVFSRVKKQNGLVTILNVPEMLGLTEAVQELKNSSEAQSLFFPLKEIQPSVGNIYSGYSQSAKYRTAAGSISISYDSYGSVQGKCTGSIRVTALRNTRVVFDTSYPLEYDC